MELIIEGILLLAFAIALCFISNDIDNRNNNQKPKT